MMKAASSRMLSATGSGRLMSPRTPRFEGECLAGTGFEPARPKLTQQKTIENVVFQGLDDWLGGGATTDTDIR
jgi:hypothetical protein